MSLSNPKLILALSLLSGPFLPKAHAVIDLSTDSAVKNFFQDAEAMSKYEIQLKTDQPAPENNTPDIFLGRIIGNDQQGIEIYCTEGSLKNCSEISFFNSVGAGLKDPTAFKKIHISDIQNHQMSKLKPKSPKFLLTSRWVFSDIKNGDYTITVAAMTPILGCLGEILVLTDTIFFPFRYAYYQLFPRQKYHNEKHAFGKSRAAIFQALTSGGTILVKNSQFDQIFNFIKNINSEHS